MFARGHKKTTHAHVKVVLDQSRDRYFVGEAVTGWVHLTVLDTCVRVHKLEAVLVGRELTRFSNTENETECSAEHCFLYIPFYLCKLKDQDVILQGDYQFKFEFVIPTWIPSSCNVRGMGSIEYSVHAALEGTKLVNADQVKKSVANLDGIDNITSIAKFDHKFYRLDTKSLLVRKPWKDRSLVEPVMYTKESYKFLFSAGSLTYSVKVDHRVIVKGTKLKVTISFDNTSSKKISDIEIYLQQTTQARNQNKSKKVKKSRIGHVAYKGLGCAPQSKALHTIEWAVPFDLNSSVIYGGNEVLVTGFDCETLLYWSSTTTPPTLTQSVEQLFESHQNKLEGARGSNVELMPENYSKKPYGVIFSCMYNMKLRFKVALGNDITVMMPLFVYEDVTLETVKDRKSLTISPRTSLNNNASYSNLLDTPPSTPVQHSALQNNNNTASPSLSHNIDDHIAMGTQILDDDLHLDEPHQHGDSVDELHLQGDDDDTMLNQGTEENLLFQSPNRKFFLTKSKPGSRSSLLK